MGILKDKNLRARRTGVNDQEGMSLIWEKSRETSGFWYQDIESKLKSDTTSNNEME